MIDAYKGISREEFPGWQGWKIVSDYEKFTNDPVILNQLCDNNVQLQELVAQFYEGGKNG
jgi:hypothetical protein